MKLLPFLTLFTAFAAAGYDFTQYKRIVCFGDSITHGGFYHMYLQEYFAETDPMHPREVTNRGIGGNTSSDLLRRVDSMLKMDHPDLVIIMIGINDLQFTTVFAEKDLTFEDAVRKYPVFNTFEKNLAALIDKIKNAGADVILLGTPPYNESANPQITEMLKENLNSSGVKNLQVIEKKLAKQKGCVYIDTYAPMLQNLQKNDSQFPRGKTDRVHPSKQEHLLIAQSVIGKKYIPGSKAKLAEEYANIQKEIQQIEAYYDRIPKSCTTLEEQINFYKKWVSGLTGNDFEYWDKMLPKVIDTIKKSQEKLHELYLRQKTAFAKLYPKYSVSEEF